ncbi:hypothetical protein, partial [Lacticaseibacillus sp. N501-2]|uniref:hypothetical protein n=1 Tax=Lacticaseibacillus salsurae TaxID=3367729 RepID=UPI0038B32F57
GLFVVHRSPTSPLSQYSQRSKRCFQTGQMRFHVPNTEVNNPGEVTFGVYEYAWIFGFTHSQQLHSSVIREWTQRQNAARALSFG